MWISFNPCLLWTAYDYILIPHIWHGFLGFQDIGRRSLVHWCLAWACPPRVRVIYLWSKRHSQASIVLGDRDHRLATVVTVVVIVTVMVVLPSVVVASETERLSSVSPHPCKKVETKDPTKMATWHGGCASLSFETAVNTAMIRLSALRCFESLMPILLLSRVDNSHIAHTWQRNLNKPTEHDSIPRSLIT